MRYSVDYSTSQSVCNFWAPGTTSIRPIIIIIIIIKGGRRAGFGRTVRLGSLPASGDHLTVSRAERVDRDDVLLVLVYVGRHTVLEDLIPRGVV